MASYLLHDRLLYAIILGIRHAYSAIIISPTLNYFVSPGKRKYTFPQYFWAQNFVVKKFRREREGPGKIQVKIWQLFQFRREKIRVQLNYVRHLRKEIALVPFFLYSFQYAQFDALA